MIKLTHLFLARLATFDLASTTPFLHHHRGTICRHFCYSGGLCASPTSGFPRCLPFPSFRRPSFLAFHASSARRLGRRTLSRPRHIGCWSHGGVCWWRCGNVSFFLQLWIEHLPLAYTWVARWRNDRVQDLQSTGCGFESQPPRCQVQPRQVVNTDVPLSTSSIIWHRPIGGDQPCGWEGNRRSGVTLATRHRH